MWPACLCASTRPRDDQANQATRAAARLRGQKTPASRTQSRIRPPAAENRQNPHLRRRRRSIWHLHHGGNRMNPVMKVPCQNRPHLLPTGRWSGAGRGDGRCEAAGRLRRRLLTSGRRGAETNHTGFLCHSQRAFYQTTSSLTRNRALVKIAQTIRDTRRNYHLIT